MKSIVLAAAATALLSTAALAQPAPEQHGVGQVQSTTPNPPPSYAGELAAHHMRPGPAQEAGRGGSAEHGWQGMMGRWGHRPPRRPPPSPAARFRLVHRANGTGMIDIKCADNEPTKVCIDAAVELLNKVETMGGSDESTGPDSSDE